METLRLRRGGITAFAPRWCNSARSLSLSNAFAQKRGKTQPLKQRHDAFAGMALSRHQAKVDQVAQAIHQHHDLAGQTTARAPDGLSPSPPFAPVAFW